jgi:hypothetical protein
MNSEYLLYTGALRVFDDFSSESCGEFVIEHDIVHPDFRTLHEKYPIREVAGRGDDFSKAINLMRWVYDNVLHNGGRKDVEFVPKNSLSILDYSFGKGVEFGVYCRLQAIVFTECCLSIWLCARTLHCLPFSPYDFDSHVVSMVWIESLKKWVMFDAGNNAYFTDENQMPLSPIEVRNHLSINSCFVSNALQPRYETASEEKNASYMQYMAKNLFYFKFSAKNTFGTDLVDGQKTYHLTPLGFQVREREIAYCKYAINNSPDPLKSGWMNALNDFQKQIISHVSLEQFLRVA